MHLVLLLVPPPPPSQFLPTPTPVPSSAKKIGCDNRSQLLKKSKILSPLVILSMKKTMVTNWKVISELKSVSRLRN